MKRNLILLTGCQAILASAQSMLGASAALVASSITTNKGLATLPLSIVFLAVMLTTFPASLLMRRVGRRNGFIVGAFVGMGGAVISLVAIQQSSFTLLCIGAAGIGALSAFGQFYRFAAIDAVDAAYESRAVSWVLSGGVAGAFVGPNLATVTRDLIGPAFFGTYGALLALYLLSLSLVSFIRLDNSDGPQVHGAERPLIEVATQPKFMVAALSAMIGYGVMSLIMSATPLAMDSLKFPFHDTAFVIQWHVVAMFAPSFVSGHLIRRYGSLNIMIIGGLLNLACVAVNLTGNTTAHFAAALVLLGVGWNFLYIGGTTLLTKAYRPCEKAKAQGLNDLLVFAVVAAASLSSGALLHLWGWQAVNAAVIPFVFVAFAANLWLKMRNGAQGHAEQIREISAPEKPE